MAGEFQECYLVGREGWGGERGMEGEGGEGRGDL